MISTLKYRAFAASIGLTILMAVMIPTFPVAGQSAVWSAPLHIAKGWWQSIAVDRMGTAHLAWYDGTKHDSLMYARRLITGEWSTPNDVIFTGDGGYTVRNSVAISNDGILYNYYRSQIEHRLSSAPAESATSASSWSVPITFTQGYYLDMLVDQQNVIHLISSTGGNILTNDQIVINLEDAPCPLCGDLIYWRSTDKGKTWSTAINLSDAILTGSDRMDIWQGASGRIYVIWDEGVDWYAGRGVPVDVRLKYSDDNGESWSDSIVLDGGRPGLAPVQIAAAELDDQSLVAVWRYASPTETQIYYQVTHDLGETWSAPEPIPGIRARNFTQTPLDDYELIADLTGVLHLFFVGSRETDPDINESSLFEIEYRQGGWRVPQRIEHGNENKLPEWPKAAVGPQNEIHLSWFYRIVSTNPNNRRSSLEVYYAYRNGTLPNRPTQAFVPTSTPQPTAVAQVTFEPTSTALPTVAPYTEPIRAKVNQDNYATETLLGAMFVSVIFCAIILIVHRFRWRA